LWFSSVPLRSSKYLGHLLSLIPLHSSQSSNTRFKTNIKATTKTTVTMVKAGKSTKLVQIYPAIEHLPHGSHGSGAASGMGREGAQLLNRNLDGHLNAGMDGQRANWIAGHLNPASWVVHSENGSF
jgi:hypothetical protein